MTIFKKLKRALGIGSSKRRIRFIVDEKGVLHIDHSVIVHGNLTADGDRLLRINIKTPDCRRVTRNEDGNEIHR